MPDDIGGGGREADRGQAGSVAPTHRLPSRPDSSAITDTHTWQVIHAISLGAASARQDAGRGLAEHWGSLRYSQAMEANRGTATAELTTRQRPAC